MKYAKKTIIWNNWLIHIDEVNEDRKNLTTNTGEMIKRRAGTNLSSTWKKLTK